MEHGRSLGILGLVGALLLLALGGVPAVSQPTTATVTGHIYEIPPGQEDATPNPRGVAGVTVSDGENMTRTGADGWYELEVDLERRHTDLIFISVPAGYTIDADDDMVPQFYHHLDVAPGDTETVDFTVRRDPEQRNRVYSALALADVHVQAGTTNNRERFSHQIEQLNELVRIAANGPDARRATPRFTIVAGDLTNDATDNEFLDYRAAAATSLLPMWPAVGNHEYFPGAGSGYADIIDNYRRHMGPEWYSFSYGRQHFVVLENNSEASLTDDAQLEWLRQDLEWNAQDKTVVVITHKPLNNAQTVNPARTQQFIDLLEEYDTKLLLAGHTHANDAAADVIEGANHVVTNSASYTIDSTPNGFRVLDFEPSGEIAVPFRKFETTERKITPVNPAPGALMPAEPAQLVVNAYHTSSWATRVDARVEGEGWVSLEPRGDHAWVAPFDASELDEGEHELTIRVTDNGGERTTQVSEFEIVPAGSTETPQPDVDWSMFHGDAQHSGVAGGELSPELGFAWAWHSDGTILTSSPAIHDGAAFIGIRDENGPDQNGIAAVDIITGEERWRVHADAQVVASPAAVDGIVYAGSIRGTTYAVDAATGEVLWEHRVGPDRRTGRPWQYFSPTVADGVVYQPYQLHGEGTKMAALDAVTGEELWVTTGSLGSSWYSHASPAVGEDYVYTVAGGVISAVNREDGTVAWTSQPAGGWMRSMPMYADGLVLMNYQGDVLVAVDGETGQEVWRYNSPASSYLHGNGTASVAAVADGVAYVGFADGNVTAIDLEHGSALWSQRTGGGVISSPAVSGDYVYVGSNDGHMYGLDRETGQPLWEYEIGTWVASSPAVSGNTVVVGAWDGALYAFTPDGSDPAERWPRTTISGVVSDDDGAPVSGARVLVLDGEGDLVGQTRTGDDGGHTVTVVGEPASYEVIAVRRGYLGAREEAELAEDGAEIELDLELDLVREPIAGVADTPTDFRHSNAHTESVQLGDTYHYAMNDLVHATITSRVAGNNSPGAFQEGWLTDFTLTDDAGMETLDWTEYVLTTEEPGTPDWNRPGEWLPLPDISVEGDAVVASGVAEIDENMEATMRYRTLPDAPVVKLTLELANTGSSDFDGYFHYNIDPDTSDDVAIVPGLGTDPGYVDGGWTSNFVYNGPTSSGTSQPAHGIAWADDEPHTLSAHGYISGAWFDAAVEAGGTRTISWYHITDYAASGGDVTANIARWAADLDILDDDVDERARLSGVVDDGAGEPLPDARVALRDGDGNTVADTRTGDDGLYSFVIGAGGLAPGEYTGLAWTRGYLPTETAVTVEPEGGTLNMTAAAITEPVAGASDVPPDVNPSSAWTGSVVPGDTYHYVANEHAQVTITSRSAGNNSPGAFHEGWLADFTLSDEHGVETLDWAEYVLTTEEPGTPDWNRPGEWLPLPDISVEGDAVVASGVAEIDENIEATMRYRMLPDAPVVKLALELANTGSSDFDGYFHYNLDPDSLGSGGNQLDQAVVPGISGINPGLVSEGWTANYVYDGPQTAVSSPAHGIAWLDDEPHTLSAHGYIFGAWFDASVAAGDTRTISWYHITDYSAGGDNPTANVAAWAAQLADLDSGAARE